MSKPPTFIRAQKSSNRNQKLMRNADVSTEHKLQFFCPFVLRSLRPSDILVLVTTKFLSMTTSMKGTPHQRCFWPIFKNLQLVWLIFYLVFSVHSFLNSQKLRNYVFYLNHGLKSTPFRYRLRPYEITPTVTFHYHN